MSSDNFQNILVEAVNSDNNLNYLVEKIYQNFKIGEKSKNRCINIIKKYISELLKKKYNITNRDELIKTIENINYESYQKISKYLISKYPNIQKTTNVVENNKVSDEIIVIDRQQRDALLEYYGIDKTQNDFLSYLSNPKFLELFCKYSALNNGIVIEKIIDRDELDKMLYKKNISVPEQKEEIELEPLTETYNDINKISGDMLPKIHQEMMEIKKIENDTDSDDIKSKCVERKKQLIDAVTNYKTELDTEKKIYEKKKMIQSDISKSDNDSIYMDIIIDPNQDGADLTKIIIPLEIESNVREILLMSYMIPHNKNNITKFNNYLKLYYNEKVVNLKIPEGNYTIEQLINYISHHLSDFTINIDNENYVTITNNKNIDFEILQIPNTVCNILGFTSEGNYRDSHKYKSIEKYCIDCNNFVKIKLRDSVKETDGLEFDKEIIDSKGIILKKLNNGFNTNQIYLQILDKNNQIYPISNEFKLCIKIILDN